MTDIRGQQTKWVKLDATGEIVRACGCGKRLKGKLALCEHEDGTKELCHVSCLRHATEDEIKVSR